MKIKIGNYPPVIVANIIVEGGSFTSGQMDKKEALDLSQQFISASKAILDILETPKKEDAKTEKKI